MSKTFKQALLFAIIVTIADLGLTLFGKDELINFHLVTNNTLNIIINLGICFVVLFIISYVMEKLISLFESKIKK